MNTNKELAVCIGKQMYQGRLLCGFKQHKAAEMLGISTDLLNKYEKGLDIVFVPALVVFRAAKLYDITTDFLYGFSGDDWERDPVVLEQRRFGVLAQEFYTQQLSALAVRVASQQRQIDVLNESAKALIGAITKMDEALSTFQKMNSFEDLKAGSQLVYRMKAANSASDSVIRSMVRKQLLPQSELHNIEVIN